MTIASLTILRRYQSPGIIKSLAVGVMAHSLRSWRASALPASSYQVLCDCLVPWPSATYLYLLHKDAITALITRTILCASFCCYWQSSSLLNGTTESKLQIRNRWETSLASPICSWCGILFARAVFDGILWNSQCMAPLLLFSPPAYSVNEILVLDLAVITLNLYRTAASPAGESCRLLCTSVVTAAPSVPVSPTLIFRLSADGLQSRATSIVPETLSQATSLQYPHLNFPRIARNFFTMTQIIAKPLMRCEKRD